MFIVSVLAYVLKTERNPICLSQIVNLQISNEHRKIIQLTSKFNCECPPATCFMKFMNQSLNVSGHVYVWKWYICLCLYDFFFLFWNCSINV